MNVLVVVPRYGDVVGGSEAHARATAIRLSLGHTVEVATTTAQDGWTWANHFPAGDGTLDGIRIRRFPVASGRRTDFRAVEKRVLTERHTLADEQDWLTAQGPHCPALLDFLHDEGARYDALLFYAYGYEPTAAGLPIVPERSGLISVAHDAAPLGLAPYRLLFHMPRAFGFLTPEERDLVQRRFANGHIPYELLGTGMDPAPAVARDDSDRERPVLLYLGEVSEEEGIAELVSLWDAHLASGGRGTLVLAGTARMSVPTRDSVVVLGSVSDEEKWSLLASADALVLPSRSETLGTALLEAWQVRTPVLVPRTNAVTSGQVARSRGGSVYDAASFRDAVAAVVADGDAMGARGLDWVTRECSWDAYGERLERLLGLVTESA